jgi:hypothetical protein
MKTKIIFSILLLSPFIWFWGEHGRERYFPEPVRKPKREDHTLPLILLKRRAATKNSGLAALRTTIAAVMQLLTI